jgi:chromosomal replication initiation ATPase DnaA
MILSPADLARCDDIASKGLAHVKPFVDAVAEATGIPARLIYGQSRKAQYAQARQLVYFLAHQSGVGFSTIARAMHRDHTTVMHGVKAEANRRANKGLALEN